MNTTAAVTPDKSDIKLMKALWAEGLSLAAIADKFELPVEVVREVCTGRKARKKRLAKVKHGPRKQMLLGPSGNVTRTRGSARTGKRAAHKRSELIDIGSGFKVQFSASPVRTRTLSVEWLPGLYDFARLPQETKKRFWAELDQFVQEAWPAK